MVNSKNKGGNFERNLAKELSLWLSNGEDDSWIWRTSSSGGRSTQRSKKGKTTQGAAGDLTFTDERAAPFFDIFSVELKIGYNDTNPLLIIDSGSKNHSFKVNLEQCIRDAELVNKQPLLIFKRDRMKACVCLQVSYFNSLIDEFGNLSDKVEYIKIWDGDKEFIILKSIDFFEWANPEYFRKR